MNDKSNDELYLRLPLSHLISVSYYFIRIIAITRKFEIESTINKKD